jgi:hypothetical protein
MTGRRDLPLLRSIVRSCGPLGALTSRLRSVERQARHEKAPQALEDRGVA